MTLYHYTCDHGRQAIGASGRLTPAVRRVPPGQYLPAGIASFTARFVWLTDLDAPMPEALGLTSRLLQCDRTAHRYRAVEPHEARRWVDVRRNFLPHVVETLEAAPGAMPAHWWVSETAVLAVLDRPKGAAA